MERGCLSPWYMAGVAGLDLEDGGSGVLGLGRAALGADSF